MLSTGLKEHFTSEMLGLDIGNPELFNRHASSEHMVKVGMTMSCFLVVMVTYCCQATLCAGLYPNLLRGYRSERGDQWGRVSMETK